MTSLLQAVVDPNTGSPAGSTNTSDKWSAVRASVWAAVYAGILAVLTSLLSSFQGTNYAVAIHGIEVPISLILVFVLRWLVQYLQPSKG